MRLLIVEDEVKLAEALKHGLELKGFAVDWVPEPEKALSRILLYRNDYSLILLDLMLPEVDGATITQKAREAGVTTPIIILTARGETEHKIDLLNKGADDYVVKPFAFEELLARINSVLRRPVQAHSPSLSVGDITMDPGTHIVTVHEVEIALTLKEYALLECFMRKPNEVIMREELFNQVWDFNSQSWSNVLDVHIKNLRKKLSNAESSTNLETVRGVGYRLVA